MTGTPQQYPFPLVLGPLILLLGTAILLKPGIIAGGSVTHECPLTRSIGYYLEPIIMLAPFAKKPLSLTLKGITTDDQDLSVSSVPFLPSRFSLNWNLQADLLRTVTLPHLQLFGISEGLELRVQKFLVIHFCLANRCSSGEETRESPVRRRRGSVPVPDSEASQDPQFR